MKREQRKLQRDIKDFKKRSNTEDKAAVKPEVAEEAEEKKDEDTEGNGVTLGDAGLAPLLSCMPHMQLSGFCGLGSVSLFA